MHGLDGKVALVTGAGTGVGAATARLLGTNRQRIYRFLRGEEEAL